MLAMTPKDNWENLKKKIEGLKLAPPSFARTIFCVPSFGAYDDALLKNLSFFLNLVDTNVDDPTDKYTIMIGALSHFINQKDTWLAMASGSGTRFVNTIAPLLEGSEKIKREGLKAFAKFIKDNSKQIFSRKDDKLMYLFANTSASDTDEKIQKQLEAENNLGILSQLWDLSPFR